jgi:hypothetical protein
MTFMFTCTHVYVNVETHHRQMIYLRFAQAEFYMLQGKVTACSGKEYNARLGVP